MPFSWISSPEPVLALATLAVAGAAAAFGLRWPGWWERAAARLPRRRAVVVAALAPLVLRALLLPWHPVPEPRVHDEFSFLLGADTLAHGRLANPQHPRWVHFESMHILARPTYASAFPAGPAAALALGQRAFGHPWAGVWLSMAAMCGAICWMLQGWLPPRWALTGAVLVGLRLGVSSYWMNSYWGGAVAAASGALVLGALPRILRAPCWRHAAVMGVGLAGLAASRPFEGAILGLAVAVPIGAHLLRMRGAARAAALRATAIPLAAVLAVAGAGLGVSFARVTGRPWVAPYLAYRNAMTMAPHFLWQSPRPEPLYNNREMRHFYTALEMESYRTARAHLAAGFAEKGGAYWRFYFGPLLTIPLLAFPFLWKDGAGRMALLLAGAFSVALAGQVWHNVHYAAPATGLFVLLVVMGMRRLRLWRRRKDALGLHLVRCLPIACLALLVIQAAARPRESGGWETAGAGWRWPSPGGVARARILDQLQRLGGKHLVLVRYGYHEPGNEWVYNGADIDGSPVVWARELNAEENAALIGHFAGRRVWLVEPDEPAPRLTPYAAAPSRLMPFVRLGAPGITALRSIENVRTKVWAISEAGPEARHGCDVWNYWFSVATGVAGPDCISTGGHGRPVSFEDWFAWVERQR